MFYLGEELDPSYDGDTDEVRACSSTARAGPTVVLGRDRLSSEEKLYGPLDLFLPPPRSDGLADRHSGRAGDPAFSEEAREASALFSASERHLEEGDAEPALARAAEALASFQRLDDLDGVADALRAMVHAHCLRGDYEKALSMARQEVSQFRRSGFLRGQASMLLAVAQAAGRSTGSRLDAALCEEAIEAVQQALPLFAEVDDERLQATLLLELALARAVNAARSLDRAAEYQEALQVAERAGRLFRSCGHAVGEGRSLHAAALAHCGLGQMQKAIHCARGAVRLFHEAADERKLEAFALRALAGLHMMSRDHKEAVADARQACWLFRSVPVVGGDALALATLVEAHLEGESSKEAIEVALEALERFQLDGDGQSEAAALELLMQAYAASGDIDSALGRAHAGLLVLNSLEDKRRRGNLFAKVAQLFLRKEEAEVEKALTAAQEACRLLRDEGDIVEEALALRVLAKAHLAKREFREALLSLDDGKALYFEIGDREGEGLALLEACSIHHAAGEVKAAMESAKEALRLLEEVGSARGVAHARQFLAVMHTEREESELAIRAGTAAKELFMELGDKPAVILASLAIVDAQIQLGKPGSRGRSLHLDRAMRVAKEALALARRVAAAAAAGSSLEGRRLVVATLAKLAEVHLVGMRLDEGLRTTAEGLALCRRADDLHGEARFLLLQSHLHLFARRHTSAEEVAQKAWGIYREIGDEDGVALALEAISFAAPGRSDGAAAAAPPAPSAPAEGGGLEYKGPTADLLSHKLRALVRDMFNVEDIEEDTELLDVGLDSLAALDFHARLTREFPGASWSATMLFDCPCIKELATMMEGSLQAAQQRRRLLSAATPAD